MAELLNESFEGTGIPGGWTDASGGGTINWDEATVVGHGSQSLQITSSGTNDDVYGSISASTTVYGHFMWRWASLGGTATIHTMRTTGSIRLEVQTSSSGALTILHGSASATVTDAVPTNTWVHIWVRYTAGSGSNGIGEIGWSTDTTRPTSGTKFASVTTGTNTTSVDRFYVGSNANETLNEYFDQVIADDAAYPSISGGEEQPRQIRSGGVLHMPGSRWRNPRSRRTVSVLPSRWRNPRLRKVA